jgi:hypothetical protein
MATKFSDFNSETTLSNITGLVGYISSSNTNVRISPTDLITGLSIGLEDVLNNNDNGGANLMELDHATLAGIQLRMSATGLAIGTPGAGANIYYGDGAGSGDFRIEADRTIGFHTDSGTVFQLFENSGNPQMDVASNTQFRLGGFTGGSILFMEGIRVTEDNSNLFWDNSNNRLGVGTNTPNATLEVSGSTRVTDLSGVGNRMVIADADGDLSTQAIPSGGASALGDLSDATTPATDNIGLGSGALGSLSTGDYNSAVGINAGTTLSTTSFNSFFGYQAGRGNSGTGNVAVGRNSLEATGSSAYSVAIGYNAGNSITGNSNTVIGGLAGDTISTGTNNVMLGYGTDGIAAGSTQIAIGYNIATTQTSSLVLGTSGKLLLHGEYGTAGNTKLGVNLGNTFSAPTANLHVKGGGGTNTTFLIESQGGAQLMKMTETGQNILIGARAGDSITSSNFNVLIGSDAGTNITGTNGDNVAIGKSANSTGSPYWNVAIGAEALQNAAGAAHVAVGKTAMKGGGGLYSTALGFQAGYKTGNHSVAIGAQAMGGTSASNSGIGNIAIGYQTMNTGSARTGQYNIALGYQAGATIASASDNILIGRGVNPSSNSATDELRIGKNTVLPLAANLSTGAVTINQAYTLPVADGTPNQVLQTDGAGNISFATASGGGGLTPTTQTTNYTASANDFVICNVTTSLVVTLPAASSGAIVGVKYASQNAATDVCSVLTPAGVQIDGVVRSATALVLPSLNTYYEFISDGTNWFIK